MSITPIMPIIPKASTKCWLAQIFADVMCILQIPTHSKVSTIPDEVLKAVPVAGYVHTLDGGNALFITNDRKAHPIPIEMALFYHLNTGDQIRAKVVFSHDHDNYITHSIESLNHVHYDDAEMIPTQRSFTLGKHTIQYGTSVLIPVGDNTDIAKQVNQIFPALPADVVPFFLSFDGRATNFTNLPSMTEFTKPSYSSREKLMACLLTFFRAKQQAAAKGKDVVIVIDSLDKMFTAFNSCMQKAGMIDPSLYSSGAVTDFENILRTSGCLAEGGSLTIIGLHHTGFTLQAQQIRDRLYQIMDAILD